MPPNHYLEGNDGYHSRGHHRAHANHGWSGVSGSHVLATMNVTFMISITNSLQRRIKILFVQAVHHQKSPKPIPQSFLMDSIELITRTARSSFRFCLGMAVPGGGGVPWARNGRRGAGTWTPKLSPAWCGPPPSWRMSLGLGFGNLGECSPWFGKPNLGGLGKLLNLGNLGFGNLGSSRMNQPPG